MSDVDHARTTPVLASLSIDESGNLLRFGCAPQEVA